MSVGQDLRSERRRNAFYEAIRSLMADFCCEEM